MAHDLIIVDLQLTYFCLHCIVLKLPILWPRWLISKILSWIWFLHARNLWAVIKIHLITLNLGWPISVIVSRSFITYLPDRLDTINWANSCLFFCGQHVYCSLGHYLLFFLLWPWSLLSRSSCENLFHPNGFFPNFVKSTRGILVKHVRKLHRLVAHDILIIALRLTYFCMYCVQLKLSIWLLFH